MAAVPWLSAGLIITLKRRITGEKYRENTTGQVHPIMQTLFSARDGFLKDDNALIHGRGLVQSAFDELEVKVKHLPWPVQSTNLNIIEPIWSVLQRSLQN
ncbi:DDE_3 domain-containing protein [Trichonephila clavipes]|nr:DDE_3 domain-containing protein [Trichonephila clavipes]